MSINTVLLLIAATIIALLVAVFQYFYKAKSKSKKTLLFAFLRFLSILTLLVLLINPKISITKTTTEKPDLVVLSDESKSITYLKQNEELKTIKNNILNNNSLKDKFEISNYSFANSISDSVVLEKEANHTQINTALKNIQKIHRKSNTAIVILTDGNQTLGSDYAYYKSTHQQPIYSIVFGDTTAVEDFKVAKINVNKYAYLNNEFPVEVLLTHSGKQARTSQLKVFSGKQVVFSKKLSFTEEKKSEFVSFNLKAKRAGTQTYHIKVVPFTGEKNKLNNTKNIVVEVIDQKTNVLLVSDISHPDIAALKRSIESNARRSLTVVKSGKVKRLEDYQIVVFYQPNSAFKGAYNLVNKANLPVFTITGKHTDWNFLNKMNLKFSKQAIAQTQEVLPLVSANFGIFITDAFNLENYPPLRSKFGAITLKAPFEILLNKKIAGVETNEPLLTFWNIEGRSEVALFGEGFWKWRLANFKRDQDFKKFDDLFGKTIQFLSNTKARRRLTVNYESVYYTNNPVKISASYFNKNYEFDAKASLVLSVKNSNTKAEQKIPMVLQGNFYEADVSFLSAGAYTFIVKAMGSNIKSSGGFSILDFDIEAQFMSPNTASLKLLIETNEGSLFYPNQTESLIEALKTKENLKPIEKSTLSETSLISWKYLLLFLLALLSIEWFLRKFNGLI